MNKYKKITKTRISDVLIGGALLLLRFGFILIMIGVCLLCSLVIGGIVKYPWVVIISDMAFCYILWLFFSAAKKRYAKDDNKGFKGLFLFFLGIVVMVVLILMATLGIAITTAPWIMINIFVLPGGILVTIFIFLYRKSIEEQKRDTE